MGYGTGLAAKERKDRKKERDKKLLEWAEIRRGPWADNRDYLEFDPLIFRTFCAFCAFLRLFPLCTAIAGFPSISRGFLSCHFGKLVDIAVARCEQSGDDSLSGLSELVTMSAGDFL